MDPRRYSLVGQEDSTITLDLDINGHLDIVGQKYEDSLEFLNKENSIVKGKATRLHERRLIFPIVLILFV